jgi:uncharacterized membrane protein (DUF2068 family)
VSLVRAMTRDRRGLLGWIIAFKAIKAVALTASGIALITTRHSDPGDLLVRLAMAVHIPLSSRFLGWLLTAVSGLTITKRTLLGITAFCYAALMAGEGTARYLWKPWAFGFTIIATSLLVPIELYEIAQKPDVVRVIVLATNLAIIGYLWQRRRFADMGEPRGNEEPLS